ncbi:MAG: M23 family metallopeptidase [Elusimicrobia bacterium]|nr:M23 family metallopeptidase [Elusimicrobiota bacterium]
MRLLAAAAAVLLAVPARAAAPLPSAAAFARYSVLTPAGPDEPPPAALKDAKRLLYAVHRVERGEYSASKIAKEYGTTLSALQSTNHDELLLMYPGMRLTIPNRDGELYEVRRASETLDRIVARFRSGAAARRELKELIARANRLPGIALLAPYELKRGDRLLIPGVRMSFDTYHFPFRSQNWPRISSGFGYRFHPILHRRIFHDGFDIPKPYGTPVYPARSGRVVSAGWHEGYGELVEIRHFNGESTLYGHLSKIYVHVGQIVERGRTLLGRVGSTGISTGPHLHFEVRDRYGRPVSPRGVIGRTSARNARRDPRRKWGKGW